MTVDEALAQGQDEAEDVADAYREREAG
jgi:hypothetical protein